MAQQAPDASCSSALLRCLSRLDVDAWAQVLLPKLKEQGSARDFALTCSQLCDLCYGTVQHLNLSSLAEVDSSQVESWVQSVPQHFQHCTSVQLLLQDDTSYHAIPYMLPALARLPQLHSISLRIEGVLHPGPIGVVLYMLRTQLANSLRCLHLDLQQSWVGAAQAWREVGQFRTLTKLEMVFGKQVTNPVVELDVPPLANLHSLQRLVIGTSNKEFQEPLLSVELADGLTSLTSLYLSGCPVSCLRHAVSCTALEELTAACPVGREEELGQAEWEAVGQLTGLETLQLFNASILTPTAGCCAALGKLSRLQDFAAWTLSTDVLSALAVCTQLTAVGGCWQQGDSSVQGITLPGVRLLYAAMGCPPFAALPKLVRVEQTGSLSAAAFAAMAQRCTGLQHLLVSARIEQATSLPLDAPRTARIAAVKALSALTSLERLELLVQDSAELAALVDVVGQLLPKGVLWHLGVFLLDVGVLQPTALMPLAKLQGLEDLVLQAHFDLADEIGDHAADILGALSGIADVQIVGLESDFVLDQCLDAQAALQAAGLPCPKRLRVQMCE